MLEISCRKAKIVGDYANEGVWVELIDPDRTLTVDETLRWLVTEIGVGKILTKLNITKSDAEDMESLTKIYDELLSEINRHVKEKLMYKKAYEEAMEIMDRYTK